MTERMKFVNLMGHIDDIDHTIETYIMNYDIQLEYASSEVYATEGLTRFSGVNPYAEPLKKTERVLPVAERLMGKRRGNTPEARMSKERAVKNVNGSYGFLEKQSQELGGLGDKKERLIELIELFTPYEKLDLPVETIRDFHFIECHVGKMPKSSYMQFQAYLYDDQDILLYECQSDEHTAWVVYFMPMMFNSRVTSIFAALNFESVEFPETFDGQTLVGPPSRIIAELSGRLAKVNDEIERCDSLSIEALNVAAEDLAAACYYVNRLYLSYDCRKYAIRTERHFFIFVGWMTERDALRLNKELESDNRVILILENDNESIRSDMPTKLRNPRFFRPFEFFVKMYGLPGTNEIDPTPFVALTYCMIYGLMFGDLGQGAVLSLLGLLLYRKKGWQLGSIIAIVGVFSMFFGVMYGSVFGFEDVLFPAVWLSPLHSILDIMIYTLVGGIAIIIVSMVIGIVNAVRQRDAEKALFGANSITGLIFYLAVLGNAAAMFLFQMNVPIYIAVPSVSVPLLVIMFKKPLAGLVQPSVHTGHMEGGVGLFILESLMELVETVLAFFTNTMSFVRVGGFAVAHAGLMKAVMVMAGADSGQINWLVIILGNIFVMGLEGLVVGIQALRLEFYEMFSRYYTGGGREFRPYNTLR